MAPMAIAVTPTPYLYTNPLHLGFMDPYLRHPSVDHAQQRCHPHGGFGGGRETTWAGQIDQSLPASYAQPLADRMHMGIAIDDHGAYDSSSYSDSDLITDAEEHTFRAMQRTLDLAGVVLDSGPYDSAAHILAPVPHL